MKRLILTTMLTAAAVFAQSGAAPAAQATKAPAPAVQSKSTATSTSKPKVAKHKHVKSTKQGTAASTKAPTAPVSK